MTRPPRPLSQTLLVPLVALVVLIAIVSGIVRIAAVERGYHETMIVGADQLSRGLTSATWHAMLADDRQAAYDMMQVMARQQGISRIRIFNKEGRIMFSTAREAAPFVDKNAEACVLCHASAQPLVRVETPSRARVFSDPAGQRRLAMITPIYNEPSCSTAACHAHPARQTVLGVLDVALDLGPADRLIAAARRRVVADHCDRGGAHLGVPGRVHQLLRDASHPPAHGRQRRPRSNGPRAPRRDRVQPRAVEPGPLVQRDAGPPARGPGRDQPGGPGAGDQGGGAHRPAPAGAAGGSSRADRLASLGQLAASVAHEINNPLSGVLNFSAAHGTHPQGGRDPEGARGGVPAATSTASPSETARAGRIVSDLLAFSRRSKPQRAPADLNALVQRRPWASCRTSSSC